MEAPEPSIPWPILSKAAAEVEDPLGSAAPEIDIQALKLSTSSAPKTAPTATAMEDELLGRLERQGSSEAGDNGHVFKIYTVYIYIFNMFNICSMFNMIWRNLSGISVILYYELCE